MRTLVIADVHGNLPALEAVLATTEAQSCQRIISLGDQVIDGKVVQVYEAEQEDGTALYYDEEGNPVAW